VTRITCRTPSTGKPVRIASNNVTSAYISYIDAPDFSVPDASNKYITRDPADSSRAIRPGEIFLLTPLAAKNKDTQDRWIEVKLVTEANVSIEVGKVEVPAGDTVFIPIQGRSLLKRNANNAIGDSLQVRAEANNIFDIWAAGEERLSSEHSGVV
jgi:hypothetical protein